MNKEEPKRFSDVFNIAPEKLDELGTFNPILNYDTKVFVNPLLLEKSNSRIIKNSYKIFENYFVDLIDLLKISKEENDKAWREVARRLQFPEYQSTCLGYGTTTKGNGSGKKLNDTILKSAKEIINESYENPKMFLLLPLFEKNIGEDRISDMTQNIIDREICDYTADIMKKLDLIGDSSYNIKLKHSYKLLKNPFSNKPIKLIPKDILSIEFLKNDLGNFIDCSLQINQNLRQTVNEKLGEAFFEKNKADRKKELL